MTGENGEHAEGQEEGAGDFVHKLPSVYVIASL